MLFSTITLDFLHNTCYYINISKKGSIIIANKKNDKSRSIILEDRIHGSNMVQMAQLLYYQLRNANLSLIELKLIDVYLSRINSHDPTAREVVFKKGELEKLFGVKRIQNEALHKYLDDLMNLNVIICSEQEDGDVYMAQKQNFTLFDKVRMILDKTDGLWTVCMRCGDDAAALIFNIDKIGYLQHAVKNTAKLSTLNSFMVYKFIESHRINNRSYPQTFTVSLDDLREQVNCVDKYATFRDFNKYVLKASRTEIFEKTTTRFDYELIYSGRFVSKVKFTIHAKIPDSPALPDNALLDDSVHEEIPLFDDTIIIEPSSITSDISDNTSVPQHYYYGNSYDYDEQRKTENPSDSSEIPDTTIAALAAACKNEFSPGQMKAILKILLYYSLDEYELFNYLEKKYIKFEMKTEETVIKNRFKYFYTMIDNDKEQGILDETFLQI